ncbi:MAG: diguanylate cyclase [Phycisphaerales bacterium]|nr:MAG: diguanylate cyclase [Phycisphaerales bacterium]
MKRTALIVDDSPSALKLIQHYLVQSDYKIVTASNGREAVRKALEVGPDLIITDWDMPEMDGRELCRAVRENDGFGVVYIIVVTGHGTEDRLVEAFEAGADDYLAKPISQSELLARLRAGERIINLEADLTLTKREIVRSNAELEVAVNLLKEANEQLHRSAITDALTGLPNRRAGLEQLQRQWAGANRIGSPLACIMVDIDHFKRVNDTHGHGVGDFVLLRTGQALRSAVRNDEMVCRIGGEEFLVICESATVKMAAVAAERLRSSIEELVMEYKDLSMKVTISLGVAQRTAEMAGVDDLLNAADAALYHAKNRGRNCVCTAPVVTTSTPRTLTA